MRLRAALRRATVLLLAALGALGALAGCRSPVRIGDPTPPGATVLDWQRSSARLPDPAQPKRAGAVHPLAGARMLEAPTTRTYHVTLSEPNEDESLTLEVKVRSTRVSSSDAEPAWRATVAVEARLLTNEAFTVEGRCEDRVGQAAAGQPGDTVMWCDVRGGLLPRSPIELIAGTRARLEIDGGGGLVAFGDWVEVEER